MAAKEANEQIDFKSEYKQWREKILLEIAELALLDKDEAQSIKKFIVRANNDR